MEANYGYADGTGDYFIIIDTDKCNACGLCLTACPQAVFELALDDYGKMAAKVKDGVVSRISYVCPGFKSECGARAENCHTVCAPGAINHTW